MRNLFGLPLLAALSVAMAGSFASHASTTGQPVFFSADEIGYDRNQSRVIALGSVKIIQGGTIVMADRITYQQNTNRVLASGKVSMRQPNGDVLFADAVALQDDLSRGVIENFRARLSDNSLFAAREARKVSETQVEMDYAVYSPCNVCKDDPDPLWQMKAKKVKLDEAAQEVYYEDASLEFYGVPVAYLPYFSHPTPNADSKSGLLSPEAGADSELGAYARVPVYIALEDNVDVTLTPMLLSKEAPVLFGEYRHLFSNGYMQWRGSATNPERRDSAGNRADGSEFRGHINAFGDFNVTDNWNTGFQLQRATDDTYQRRYDIRREDILTSRLYAENISGRRYFNIETLAFQGLTSQDDPDTTPYVLPLIDFNWEGEPGIWGSRLAFDAGSSIISRKIGANSRRLSVMGSWEVPLITPGGHVFGAKTSLRGDIYSVNDVARSPVDMDYDGSPARLIPQLELSWRYPLVNHYDMGRSVLIEPVVEFAVSPTGTNTTKIPNEDSVVPEFNDTNLFEDNRFAGYDRVETGSRFNFGMRTLWQFADNAQADFLFGQHYRTDENNPFPFSNDVTDSLSDYVGRVGVYWDTDFSAVYRFRLDRQKLTPQRSEVNTQFNISNVFLQLDYLNLNNDPFLDDRQEIIANGNLRLTDYWSLFAGTRRDLQQDQQIAANAGFHYKDECFGVYGNFSRSLIRDRDVEPDSSFILRVELENLN